MPAAKYRLYRRSNGTYYQQDHETGAQVSLRTKEKHAAKEKLRAANESVAQPRLNLDLARVYLKSARRGDFQTHLEGRDERVFGTRPGHLARTLLPRFRGP